MALHLESPGAAASLLSKGLEGHFVTGGLAWRCSDEVPNIHKAFLHTHKHTSISCISGRHADPASWYLPTMPSVPQTAGQPSSSGGW